MTKKNHSPLDLKPLKQFGHIIQGKGFLIFFGNHSFYPSCLTHKIQNNYFLRQIHGNRIVKGSACPEEADGHWSTTPNEALYIRTADCIPAFMTDTRGSCVFALHIGWKGLKQKILTNAAKAFSPDSLKNLSLWVGPHIHKENFHLNTDNIKGLLDAHKFSFKKALMTQICKPHFGIKNEWHINLFEILKREAHALGIPHIEHIETDTFSSPHHYSHRRNNYTKGRNYSFIVKL